MLQACGGSMMNGCKESRIEKILSSPPRFSLTPPPSRSSSISFHLAGNGNSTKIMDSTSLRSCHIKSASRDCFSYIGPVLFHSSRFFFLIKNSNAVCPLLHHQGGCRDCLALTLLYVSACAPCAIRGALTVCSFTPRARPVVHAEEVW